MTGSVLACTMVGLDLTKVCTDVEEDRNGDCNKTRIGESLYDQGKRIPFNH